MHSNSSSGIDPKIVSKDCVTSVDGKVKGLKGFLVMNRTNDASEIIVLSLWETESDMEVFYHPSNKAFYEFVDRASPLFENKPERTNE